MAISYPVSPESRWTVFDTTANAVIARNKVWPRADGMEIQGQADNIIYLLESTDAKPDFDSRLYRLEQNETLDLQANTATKTWTSVEKGVEERKVAAENAEAQHLQDHLRIERHTIETTLVVGAILNHIGGLQLPPKIRNFVDDYEAKAVKIWKNRDRLKAIIAEIEAGGEPDLDAGWEVGEFTPPEPVHGDEF